MNKSAPDVLMLLATGCAYCPGVLNTLQTLQKDGDIAELEAINISQQPEVAEQYNVRSVPFIKIGNIHLTGAQTRDEIMRAIEQSQAEQGLAQYYDDLLNNGQLAEATEHIHQHPENLSVLLERMQEKDIKISVQIGIGAIFEDFAEHDALLSLIPALTQLTQHSLARVRNDACFYLSLSADNSVIPTIETLLDDDSDEVRETAKDCLENLNTTN